MSQYIPITNYESGKASNINLDAIKNINKRSIETQKKLDTIPKSVYGKVPDFYDPILKDLNSIISICKDINPIFLLLQNQSVNGPSVWLSTINSSINLAIKNIMLSPTPPLFPNQNYNIYQRRLIITNDSGDPLYMKIGTPLYNTQVFITRYNTIIPIQNVPLNTITSNQTVTIRADFTPSSPPNINDIPLTPTITNIETPYTTRKEFTSAIITGVGYSNRNNLSNQPGYYVAKIFTNIYGQQFIARVSYHL